MQKNFVSAYSTQCVTLRPVESSQYVTTRISSVQKKAALSSVLRPFHLHSDAVNDLMHSDLVLLGSHRGVILSSALRGLFNSAIDDIAVRMLQWASMRLQNGHSHRQVSK